MRRTLAKVTLACAVALGVAELALHLAPGILPRAYLARFPANGTEFFHPDVFERTPVEGVLLPHFASAHHGPPPADLIELGIAPRDADDDARRFPDVELPADALGFPNPRALERAELVLVGDSFGVAAGVRRPEGLQAQLERASGLAIFNASLAGIGPVQERWIVENVALAKHPRAIVWLWFAGNDLTESYEPFLARRDGKTTWAEAWPERRKPFFVLPALIAEALRSHERAAPREPLPPFAFPTADDRDQPLWFLPDHLRLLAWTVDEWRAQPTWPPVQGELRAARDACAKSGAKLLLVYVPSAPQVLLPFVAPDAELVARTLVALGAPAPTGTPAEVLERLLANRDAQEEVVRDFCASESIPFLSATPALEDLARRGTLGYLVTDTHWQVDGQEALLAPLLDFLRAQGVLE